MDALRFIIATPADAARLHALTLRCWTGTVPANSSLYRETIDYLAAFLAAEKSGAVFAVCDGEDIGAGRWERVPGPAGDDRPWIELKRMGVLRAWRKRGIGAPLVAELERTAIAATGAAGAQLGVREDQPRLIGFWQGLGYVLADDVRLATVNPLTPPPATLRKRFACPGKA